MIDRIRGLKYIHFLIISLVSTFAVLCISGLAAYSGYSGRIKSEAMITYDVDLNECGFESMKQIEEGCYVATDSDPQIIIDVGGNVEAVEICMTAYLEPGEILLYYTNDADEGFTGSKMRWAHGWKEPDSYLFRIDGRDSRIARLRIDPTVYAGNRVNIEKIRINPEMGLDDFLVFDHVFLFKTLLYGALASVILRELFRKK